MIKALYCFLSRQTHSIQKHDGRAPEEFRDRPEKPGAYVHLLSGIREEVFYFYFFPFFCLFSLVAQSVKNPPAVQETRVPSLDREDPLEKEMATHSSILAWKISWTREPGGLQSMVLQSQARLSN